MVVGRAAALIYNVGIGLFSCALALIIWFFYKRNFADTQEFRLLRQINGAIFLVLLSDLSIWLLDGRDGALVRVLMHGFNIVLFLMSVIVALGWLKYAWFRIFGRGLTKNQEIFSIRIPFAALSVIILTSPITGWSYYLDQANVYHRGAFAVPQYLILLAYLLGVSVTALTKRRKEVNIDRRGELFAVAFFAVPPFIGGLVQTAFYGLSLVWPSAVISSLLLLLTQAGQAISQVSTTGLNNRRSLDKHLSLYKEDQNRPVTLMMLDINHFKRINDAHGHRAGDEALMEAARVLKGVVGGSNAFLARYGGDEFVVVLPGDDEGLAQDFLKRIHSGFKALSAQQRLPFQLSVSAGYAMSREPGANRTAELLRMADKRMYDDKERVSAL